METEVFLDSTAKEEEETKKQKISFPIRLILHTVELRSVSWPTDNTSIKCCLALIFEAPCQSHPVIFAHKTHSLDFLNCMQMQVAISVLLATVPLVPRTVPHIQQVQMSFY